MSDLDPDLKLSLIRTAHALADAAGKVTLRYFRMPGLEAENKLSSGFDPVTAADRDAETAMRQVLADLRPEDGILGEEHGRKDGSSGLTWVLDPVDGTRGYISGTPTWGTLIAVSDHTGPLYGIIDQPYIGERFVGGLGSAFTDGPRGRHDNRCRSIDSLSDAVLFTTFPEVGTPDERCAFAAVSEKARLTRYGMDCYAYALLAAGQIDLVIEAGLNAYDIQAPIAVIQAAGGIVTDWSGHPVHDGGQVLAAANERLHSQALDILQHSV